MKNTLVKMISLPIVALLMSGCSIEFDGDVSGYAESDNFQGVIDLFNGFTEDTLANTNLVATVKADNEDLLKETVVDTSHYVEYPTIKTYSFIKDDTYYYAVDDEDDKYYLTGEDNYSFGVNKYADFFIITMLDAEDVKELTTVSFYIRIDELNDDATLKLEVKDSANKDNFLIMEGKSNKGLITSLSVDYSSVIEDSSIDRTKYDFSFEYGNASITLPDISTWDNGDKQ